MKLREIYRKKSNIERIIEIKSEIEKVFRIVGWNFREIWLLKNKLRESKSEKLDFT